jgi:hypothetical protein
MAGLRVRYGYNRQAPQKLEEFANALRMRARSALLLFAALAVAHTWPLASSPGRLSLNHNADAELCAWTVSWIAHTLPTDPRHLFDGNIFAPEPNTLAYTDPMMVPALIAAPIRWLGGSPVLAFNLTMLCGLTLTGWATWWSARRWTGSGAAALVAGALAAFNMHLLTRLPNIGAAYAWAVPASLVLADRLMDRPDRRAVVWLGLIVAATAVTSPYWLAQVAIVVGIMAVAAAMGRRWRAVGGLAVATVGGMAVASPILWPYVRFARTGATRPIEQVAQFSATLSGYLSSVSRLHAGWSAPFFRDDVNVWFAGGTAIALALVGVIDLIARGGTVRRRGLVLLVIGVTGVWLSLGPATALYRGLYAWVLPLRGLRAAARFGYLYLAAIALAAGAGTAALERRVRSQAGRATLVAVVLTLVTAEAWVAPITTEPFSGVPALYRQVAEAPGNVRLVELPFYPAEGIFMNGEYVLNATAHWRPLMNGYSGFIPDGYRAWADRLWYFPEQRALDALVESGATHVMVHAEKFTPRELADIDAALRGSSLLTLLGTDTHGHRLYLVRRPPAS